MMRCSEKIAHGTTFRRAVEEGLLDLKRVVQIGRARGYAAGDFQWGVDPGLSHGAGGAVLAYLAGAADGRSPPADGRRAGVSQL